MGTPRLLTGPVLRYADDTRATIWVETDRACVVEVHATVLGGVLDAGQRPVVVDAAEPTWSVHGHHYALVALAGLPSGATAEYAVTLCSTTDPGERHRVWPEPGGFHPASLIRTAGGRGAVRVTFGSCRRAEPLDADTVRRLGADALVALAERLAATAPAQWPDLLFLDGDQIYADEPSDAVLARLADRPRPHPELAGEIADFEEYTWLYHDAWSEPAVRWLLSTVPTVMMLDDHDLRDDWNTSLAWRAWITSRPWWRDRVTGALASYWIYQHLGNLAPEDLEADPLLQVMRAEPDPAVRANRLDEFAFRADADPPSARWSVVRDLHTTATGGARGVVRLIALDTRCSRALEPGRRAIVDDVEWAWFRERVLERPVDHLLVGSTLPLLLPPGIHHLEGWDEAVAEGAWGRRAVRLAERLRQWLDLEHWASFRASLHRWCELLRELAGPDTSGPAPGAPATVLMLSGDVHSSYLATARLPGVDPERTALVQLTMSPFRNPLSLPLRWATRALGSRAAARVTRRAARSAGVADLPLDWRIERGTWFDNGLMTLTLTGRRARVEVERASVVDGRHALQRTHEGSLTR